MNENEIPTRIELPASFYKEEENNDNVKKHEYIEIPRRISLPSDPDKRQDMLQVIKDFKAHAGAYYGLEEMLKKAPYARVDSLAHYCKVKNDNPDQSEGPKEPEYPISPIERVEQKISYNLSMLLLTSELVNPSTNYSADIGKLLDEIEGYHINPEDFRGVVRDLNLILYPEQPAEHST